ncbi:uncharacterized protein LOC117531078 [Thalassophryne amazonica]|uniref:uncharacterized protein LOC117531078 n=1 Tax=Thalassophryne amazonica TaxID=390379 RepID=UPI001471D1E3|nr:uncharacterized protein LOC117531078 [Thalassophryne amazonica]
MPPKKVGSGKDFLGKKKQTKRLEAERRPVVETEEQHVEEGEREEEKAEDALPPHAEACIPAAPAAPGLEPGGSREQSAGEEVHVRAKKEKLQLTKEDEQLVADFFNSHPMFWDKAHKEYKDTQLKGRMLGDLARTLATTCTALQLKTWLESMRTAFGKLSKPPPSGAQPKAVTEKEVWILRNFSCCGKQIKRQGRTAGDLPPGSASSSSKRATPPLPISSDDESAPVLVLDDEVSNASTPRRDSKGGPFKARKRVSDTEQLLGKLTDHMIGRMESLEPAHAQVGPQNPADQRSRMRWAVVKSWYEQSLTMDDIQFLDLEAVVNAELHKFRRWQAMQQLSMGPRPAPPASSMAPQPPHTAPHPHSVSSIYGLGPTSYPHYYASQGGPSYMYSSPSKAYWNAGPPPTHGQQHPVPVSQYQTLQNVSSAHRPTTSQPQPGTSNEPAASTSTANYSIEIPEIAISGVENMLKDIGKGLNISSSSQ